MKKSEAGEVCKICRYDFTEMGIFFFNCYNIDKHLTHSFDEKVDFVSTNREEILENAAQESDSEDDDEDDSDDR